MKGKRRCILKSEQDLNLSMKTKEACDICFENTGRLIFLCKTCGHRFCLNCMKKHIEVKLLDGKLPNCLQYLCKYQLSIDICGKFLTPKLNLMWEQRIKENSTPFRERVYCPYKICSYFMSKAELSRPSSVSGFRICFKCRRSFCVNCKVPWHGSLSCTDYKKLHPNNPQHDDEEKLRSIANLQGWGQCVKCQHIVELSYGCHHIVCRCGHEFCYTCGSDWSNSPHISCIRFRSLYPLDAICFLVFALLVLYLLYRCGIAFSR